MDESRSTTAVLHRWSVRLTITALGIALILGWILWHSVTMFSINEVQDQVDSMKSIATGIRLALIAVILMAWPILVSCIQHRRRLCANQAADLAKWRWRIVTWLIVIEVVLGQNLLGTLFTLMQRNAA